MQISQTTSSQPEGDTVKQEDLQSKPLDRVLEFLSAVGSFWIVILMFFVCADVVSRSGFNKPLPAIAEIAGYSVVGILFLQLPASVLRKRLTRSDMLLNRLASTMPIAYKVLESVFLAFSIAVFGLLARVTAKSAHTSYTTGEQAGVPGIFSFAAWPLKLLISVMAVLSVCALLALVWRLWAEASSITHKVSAHE